MRKRYLLVTAAILSACSLLPGESPPTDSPGAPDTATSSAASETPAPTPTATLPSPTEVPTPPPAIFTDALPDPSSASWTLVASPFVRPLGVEAPGDGRLYVLEQAGRIKVVVDGQIQDRVFLDILPAVDDSASERGLLGLAFDPQYPQVDEFYINYTGAGGTTIISRISLSGDGQRADPDSEQVILTIDQPYSNHNGGSLEFGPDGMLYIGVGDGGRAGDPLGAGQRLDILLGKILRLDVRGQETYRIPPDNPFLGVAEAEPEIWDYGLRNPWRIAFDQATGDLYIADVGQNSWEEVNFEPSYSEGGRNYGWNLREGRHDYAGGSAEDLIDPVTEYSNGQFGCSVTGGHVVRDERLPDWQGVYLFGDFCSGRIWGLVRDPSGLWMSEQLYDSVWNISSFGIDPQSRIYLVNHGGELYRLDPVEE